MNMVAFVPISCIYPDFDVDVFMFSAIIIGLSSPTIDQHIRQLIVLDAHSQTVHYMLLSFLPNASHDQQINYIRVPIDTFPFSSPSLCFAIILSFFFFSFLS